VQQPGRARGEGPCEVKLRYADSGSGEGGVQPLDVPLLR